MVLRFSALGDVTMTLPVVYSLARQYPELHIDVVTRPFFAKLFINRPGNVNVIAIDFKDYKGVSGTLKLLKMLGGLKPDYVADLHNVLRSWIIDRYFRLRGVKVEMVDKLRDKRRRLFKTGERQPSFIDRYATVFKRLGYPVELTFKSLYSPDSRPAVPFKVEHPAIGIAPFARYYNKTYPAKQMREVISQLTNEGYNVYLFGGRRDEAEALKAWASQFDRCDSVAGLYPLHDEIALMSEMDVMISMDSSNQHMAALTGTPVISVWGSTTPACGFMPYKQDEANAICMNIPCQPCTVGGSKECPKGHFDCMRRLMPETIVGKVKQLLPTIP